VPDFKLEKWVVQRRTALMEEEGVIVRCGADIGRAEDGERVLARHDAVVVAIGARVPRDLAVPGRELDGVHFAMEYLYQRNRWVAARDGRAAPPPPGPVITAAGRHVVVIGGGDTAMDCIANAHREQPLSVTLLDTYPTPVGTAAREIVPWPAAPKRLASTYALDEGGERLATRTVTELVGAGGHVTRVRGAEAGPPPDFAPLPETGFEIPADLVLVAIGFAHPEHAGLLEQLAVDLDARGNVRAPAYATSRAGVFAAGDARRGQSLVVTAIAEGRRCARTVDRFLAAR
jgi:glutamate synthase (NADPH/NADH) small chain